MRHRNKVKKLQRGAAHRRALLSNLVCSLIEHKQIRTTLAKAKAVRGKVVKVDGDKLVIAKGKNGEEVTIATNADTKITIEGKEAKLADLQAGQVVAVTPAEGTATTIVVAAPKKEKAAKS